MTKTKNLKGGFYSIFNIAEKNIVICKMDQTKLPRTNHEEKKQKKYTGKAKRKYNENF